MTNKEKRHQVEDRETFSEHDRYLISKKSNDTCVWCGKKVFFGYGASVDHFIPLKKGGTNDLVNCVLMCKECNKNKGSKVIAPVSISQYMNKDAQKELEEYFDNYIQTYDHLSRGNLLVCDIYEMVIIPEAVVEAYTRSKKKNGLLIDLNKKRSKYLLKRAYPEDQERVTNYYIKYLKKYDLLSSPEAASENIKFWMRFGSIYFVEKDNEISVISTVTINKNGFISINLFSYYSSFPAFNVTRGIVSCLTDAMMSENNLAYLPISVNMVKPDNLVKRMFNPQKCNLIDGRWVCQTYFSYNKSKKFQDEVKDETIKTIGKQFKDFITKFYDIENSIQLYLYENNLMEYSWMADEILERDLFEEKYYQEVD